MKETNSRKRKPCHKGHDPNLLYATPDEDLRCAQRDVVYARTVHAIHRFFKQDSIFEHIDMLNEVFGHALQSTNGSVDDEGNPVYALSSIDVIDLFDKHVKMINFFVELHGIDEFVNRAGLKDWA